MRPLGWITSFIAHIGFIIALLVGIPAIRPDIPAESGVVVPVDIVATAPQSNVRALAIPEPDQTQTTPAAAEENTPAPEPAPSPTPAPPPATPPRHQPQNQFDVSQVQDLINRDRRHEAPHNPGSPSDHTQAGAGPGTREVVALQDRARALVRAEMLRCWRAPIDQPNPERLVVTLQFDLDRNGNLRGQPRVISPTNYGLDPAMRTAVDAALRAVRECDPYTRIANDPVVGSHYEVWGQSEYTFRPRTD